MSINAIGGENKLVVVRMAADSEVVGVVNFLRGTLIGIPPHAARWAMAAAYCCLGATAAFLT